MSSHRQTHSPRDILWGHLFTTPPTHRAAAQMEGPPQAQTPGTGFPVSEPDADAPDWAAPGKQSLEAFQGEGV